MERQAVEHQSVARSASEQSVARGLKADAVEVSTFHKRL